MSTTTFDDLTAGMGKGIVWLDVEANGAGPQKARSVIIYHDPLVVLILHRKARATRPMAHVVSVTPHGMTMRRVAPSTHRTDEPLFAAAQVMGRMRVDG